MTLEKELGALLAGRRLSLATAESCTGGLLGHRLTNIPNSSTYYLGGFITYSNDAKVQLLGVSAETLAEHGAVSEPAAREMAAGARRRLGADLALAVTGIAGPSGGSRQKPVGLVYIALSSPAADLCRRYQFNGDRLQVKQQSAEAALRLVLAYLQGEEDRMLEFPDEPVDVQVDILPDGKSRPLAFSWQGKRYEITSWGREEDREYAGGMLHCLLVQTAGPETWELCRTPEGGHWLLTRHWPRRTPVA